MHWLDGSRAMGSCVVTLNCNFLGQGSKGKGQVSRQRSLPGLPALPPVQMHCCRCTAAIIRHPNPAQGLNPSLGKERQHRHNEHPLLRTPSRPLAVSTPRGILQHKNKQINKQNKKSNAAGVMLGEAGRLKAKICINTAGDFVYFYCYIIHFLVSSSHPLQRCPGPGPRSWWHSAAPCTLASRLCRGSLSCCWADRCRSEMKKKIYVKMLWEEPQHFPRRPQSSPGAGT